MMRADDTCPPAIHRYLLYYNMRLCHFQLFVADGKQSIHFQFKISLMFYPFNGL